MTDELGQRHIKLHTRSVARESAANQRAYRNRRLQASPAAADTAQPGRGTALRHSVERRPFIGTLCAHSAAY